MPTGCVRPTAWQDSQRHLKIARIGDNMRQVAVTEGDKVEAQLTPGLRGEWAMGWETWFSI